jgi:hypothetical protein
MMPIDARGAAGRRRPLAHHAGQLAQHVREVLGAKPQRGGSTSPSRVNDRAISFAAAPAWEALTNRGWGWGPDA